MMRLYEDCRRATDARLKQVTGFPDNILLGFLLREAGGHPRQNMAVAIKRRRHRLALEAQRKVPVSWQYFRLNQPITFFEITTVAGGAGFMRKLILIESGAGPSPNARP